MFKDVMAPYIQQLKPLPTSARPENNLRTPIRAVIFDIYGTLFISASGDISNALSKSCQTSPIDKLLSKYRIFQTPEQVNEQFVLAVESEHAAARKKGIDFPEIKIEQIWQNVLHLKNLEIARQFAVEYEMITNPVYPMPNLNNTLQTLKNSNIPMGIISNAQFFTPYLFDLFCNNFPDKLGFHPDLIYYSYEHGYAKPSLVLFEKAAAELTRTGIVPEDVLYVGNDMLNDIYTAHSAGFQTCLFAGDSRSLRLRKNRPECAALKPDAIIKELNQLTDMIRSF